MPRPSVMLLDGTPRATLGIARSLARKGIPIMAGGANPLAAAAASRYVSRAFVHPPSAAGVGATHRVIIEHVHKWRPDVLMPIFGHGWRTIYAFQEEYARLTTLVPCPTRDLFERLYAKDSLAELAEEYGLPMPPSFRPRSLEEAIDLRDRLAYPVLLKPRGGVSGIGIRRADRSADLERLLAHRADVPLIQEYIEGEDLELTVLCSRGEPQAASAYLSLRNYPRPYGPPIAAVTIRDEALVTMGEVFLRRIGYHGVAHLDFRRDRRDGRPKLLDFNPRLAGTNEISARSGVNFPLLLHRLALGESVQPCFTYDVGLEFRWLLYGELLHLAQSPQKSRVLRALLRWNHVAVNVDLLDPLPHLQEGMAILKRSLLRRAQESEH